MLKIYTYLCSRIHIKHVSLPVNMNHKSCCRPCMKISYSNGPKKITGCVGNETSDNKSLSSKKVVKAISKRA